MRVYALLMISCSLMLISGCATKQLPAIVYPKAVYPIKSYPMMAEVNGLEVAAIPFEAGRDVYGDPSAQIREDVKTPLDVIDAGLMPIRFIFWNKSENEIAIFPDQITGFSDSVCIQAFPPKKAVEIVVNSRVFNEAIKKGKVGPIIRSILGGRVFIGAAKGAVGGLVSGGVTGGAVGVVKGAESAVSEPARTYKSDLVQMVAEEYTYKALKQQSLFPGFISDGLIYFPSKVGIDKICILAYDFNRKETVQLCMDLPATQ